ncbi:SDR family oxidoreductase [Ideonella sp. BN130291]|uniref:SDR family oxidoreductase n=1 Tax=Ideonella sp. BN130291 TaxID=3112940 RepID=UPI002E270160|nr:SDR family oxidoreductase [Ideonella sp. BN130291]
MKLLLTGATGFIGRRLLAALLNQGHEVVCAGRRPAGQGAAWVAMDLAQAPPAVAWLPHLRGVDAVVNLVGIFRESATQHFDALHARGPIALFDACVQAGVPRVVQLSALGADAQAATPYHLSKRQADEHLLGLPLHATVVQPSLVFGEDGPSAALFLRLATLPLLPLPAGGRQLLQPVHVDDVVAALLALLQAPAGSSQGRIPLVGPRALTLAAYVHALRRALNLPRAAAFPVPAACVALAARMGDRWPGAWLDSASWQMLQRGNSADPAAITALLGHPPREVQQFLAPERAAGLRTAAAWGWLQPLLRLSLAAVWLATAAVSFGLYPVPQSLELLARAGVPQALQLPALYGAAALDLALGIATLLPLPGRRRRWLWLAQAALIGGYSVIISLRLPEFWLHPYGPMTKNLPILALLLMLYSLEED